MNFLKKLIFNFFLFCSSHLISQNLTDRIYTKEGDSLQCKITSVEKNWIYYDHQTKKGIKNNYIPMSDIRFYVRDHTKYKPHEEDPKPVIEPRMDHNRGPKDTINTVYLDHSNNKISCRILLSTNQAWKEQHLRYQLDVIDTAGKEKTVYPNEISGFWLQGIFYKSFSILSNKKIIHFFSKQEIAGNVDLYSYRGDLLNGDNVYIFKKQSEKAYNFVNENPKTVATIGSYATLMPDGSTSAVSIVAFNDELPYLNYFQNYFSDCKAVFLKFNSKWYTADSIKAAFTDYNNCH